MRKKTVLRNLRINRVCFYSVFFLLIFFSPCLRGNDLDRAAELEASGDLESAADLYENWLNRSSNRTDPDYGRTLLHLLRSGGAPDLQLTLLEKFLPYVNNAYDKNEVLKFGAYLAELTGNLDLAEKYFSLLNREYPRYEWVISYLNLQEGKISRIEDPLMSSLMLESEDHISNRLILYLLSLSPETEQDNATGIWIQRAENAFPFLRNKPSWLYHVWSVSRMFQLDEMTREYEKLLLQEFEDSPETGIVESRISLYSNPYSLAVYATVTDPNGEDMKMSVETEFLQLGSFSDLSNAEGMKEELERNTSFSIRIVQQTGQYKVLLATESAESDQKLLKQKGYDSFKVGIPY